MTEQVIERLERLEQRYRRLRRILIASISVAVLVLLMAQAVPPPPKSPVILQASAFHVLGDDGRVRARLGLSMDGQPTLTLTDDAGTIRATLAVQNGGAP